MPLASAVLWILSPTLSVPGFVFSVVQLQEDIQSIAEALFIGSGDKARGNAQLHFDHHALFLLTGLSKLTSNSMDTNHMGHLLPSDCLSWGFRELPGSCSCLLPSAASLEYGHREVSWRLSWVLRTIAFSMEGGFREARLVMWLLRVGKIQPGEAAFYVLGPCNIISASFSF